MSTNRITPALVEAIAQAPYQGPGAPCPWDAVDPLTRHGLRNRARALLADAIPALIAAGWTPPPAAKDPDTCSCTFTNIHDGTGDLHRVDHVVNPACTIHPYCYRCDFDRHTCPGCGTNIPHGTTACTTCSTPETGTFGACCSGGDCCGPGSYCCANAGPHRHPDEPDKPQ